MIRSDDHPIGWPSDPVSTERATDWHPNHNIYCILNEEYLNMEPFREIVQFLKDSKIYKALTEQHKCYESHVRFFWKSVRYDEKE
ncbi:hypothetical protein Hanom_Chr05g00401931 [Helianthus anomalus]